MRNLNIPNPDQDIHLQALQALRQAQLKAKQSPLPFVYAANGQLLQRTSNGKICTLKNLPGRFQIKRLNRRTKP